MTGLHASWIGPVSAGVIAGVLSLIELAASLEKRLSYRASFWVSCRLLLDGVSSAIAYPLTIAAFQDLAWYRGLLPVMVAGLTGPAILRSQFQLLEKGESIKIVGVANAYRRLQRRIDKVIDDINTVEQKRWVSKRVLPAIDILSMDGLAEEAKSYLNSVDRFTAKEVARQTAFIEATLAERDTSDDSKRRAFVYYILSIGGRRFVQTLVKDCLERRSTVAEASAVN